MQSMQSMQAKKFKQSKHSKQSLNKVISITHSTISEFKDESNYSRNNKVYNNSVSLQINNRSVGKRINGLDYERKNYVHSDIGVTLGIIAICLYIFYCYNLIGSRILYATCYNL